MVLSGKLLKNTLTAFFAVMPSLFFANQHADTNQAEAETAVHATAEGHGEHVAVGELTPDQKKETKSSSSITLRTLMILPCFLMRQQASISAFRYRLSL